MVLYDPHRRWGPRGICRWEDRGLFFADGGTPSRQPAEGVQELWDQAKEICAMCPVIKECQRDTLGEEYGVYGGLDQHERYRIRKVMSRAVDRWPDSRRMAWAQEIYTLRQSGMAWRAIQTRTGLPPSAAEKLFDLWEQRPKTKKPKAEVVELQMPDALLTKQPFPEQPGRRHAWVRNNGLIADAWYRGETPDGEWINVTTFSGRGSVNKWFRKEDVHLYRPQVVVVLHYAARPEDADDRDKEEAYAAAS
ncbi:WhiB family transcriptional regulator [Streptomyces massasporeus]|uniref:WhiB family transcriptional regulator n=1 Tax=Streptomyces massasporeus TaxID=67324 RepID=UPI0037186E56